MSADHRPARGPRRLRSRRNPGEIAGAPTGLERMWVTVLRRFRNYFDDIGLVSPPAAPMTQPSEHGAEDTH